MAVDGKKLRAFVQRYESLESDRKVAGEDMAQLLSDFGEDGYDKPTLRSLIRYRKKSEAEQAEAARLLQEYLDAYRGFESTPIGRMMAAGEVSIKDDTRISIQAGDGPEVDITEAIKTVRRKSAFMGG